MIYALKFTPTALLDVEFFNKSVNKAVTKKLLVLFEELIEHPKSGTGHPEELKHKYTGY